jgi:pimeloyl-ACP methyl ester carboxylesterase
MSDPVLTEEPLQFGEGGRLFGILTLPRMPLCNAQKLPVFVFLNAGLLHRVGPHGLHVRLSRELAQLGFSSLRVDLAGTGDSPRRAGLTYPQSVAVDFGEISAVLESRLGRLPLVLAGLCSGAHNAIRLTPEEPQVIGMILLDPVCFMDRGFRLRAAAAKYANPARYIAWLKHRFNALTRSRGKKQENDESVDPVTLRNSPTREQLQAAWGVPNREQLRAAFQAIRERDGRVMSVFTQSALEYYNQAGQLGRVVGVEGYQQFCTELFWPQAEHTFPIDLHRRRLIEEIKTWSAGSFIREGSHSRQLRKN